MVGTGLGARHGILIRSGEILEITHSVDTVVLDKTGTVTEGTPAVTEVLPFQCPRETLLATAATVEAVSAHPLAQAITGYAKFQGFDASARPTSFETLSGRGIRAVLEDGTVLAGNRRLLEEAGVDISPLEAQAQTLASQGQTPMYFAKNGVLLGLISVADPVKETSADAIARMKSQASVRCSSPAITEPRQSTSPPWWGWTPSSPRCCRRKRPVWCRTCKSRAEPL